MNACNETGRGEENLITTNQSVTKNERREEKGKKRSFRARSAQKYSKVQITRERASVRQKLMIIIMSEYLLEIRNQQSEMKKQENEKSAGKDIVFAILTSARALKYNVLQSLSFLCVPPCRTNAVQINSHKSFSNDVGYEESPTAAANWSVQILLNPLALICQ